MAKGIFAGMPAVRPGAPKYVRPTAQAIEPVKSPALVEEAVVAPTVVDLPAMDTVPYDQPTTSAHVAPVVEAPMTFVPTGSPPLRTQKEKWEAYKREVPAEMGPPPARTAVIDDDEDRSREHKVFTTRVVDVAPIPGQLPPMGPPPPRRPPPVPPAPPSSGLMSSRVGTVPVPVRRPPLAPLPISRPPATGRDE